MSANTFLPKFKSSVEALYKGLQHESEGLVKTFNKFMGDLEKSEAEIKESLQSLFNSVSLHFKKHGDYENWEHLLKILEEVAKSEDGMKKEVNDIKELLKKEDNQQKKVGRERLLNKLKDEAFVAQCAKLISSKPKTKAERIKEINDGISNSFNEIYNARVGQASYSEWGHIGVELVQIIVGLVQKLAIEAGHDIPEMPAAESRQGIQRLYPAAPGKLPMPVPD